MYIFYKVLTIIKCNYKSCNWHEKERKPRTTKGRKDHIVCPCGCRKQMFCSLLLEVVKCRAFSECNLTTSTKRKKFILRDVQFNDFFLFTVLFLCLHLFISGCAGSSLLYVGFLQLSPARTTLRCQGFSMWWLLFLQYTDSRVQTWQGWHTGLASLRHVGSPPTRD